jgi:hypothetical protein
MPIISINCGGEGGIRTHGTVTRNSFRDRALGQETKLQIKAVAGPEAPDAEPKESHDQGANNAGCGPLQPFYRTIDSVPNWYVLEQKFEPTNSYLNAA